MKECPGRIFMASRRQDGRTNVTSQAQSQRHVDRSPPFPLNDLFGASRAIFEEDQCVGPRCSRSNGSKLRKRFSRKGHLWDTGTKCSTSQRITKQRMDGPRNWRHISGWSNRSVIVDPSQPETRSRAFGSLDHWIKNGH